jgi:hypothetical protein
MYYVHVTFQISEYMTTFLFRRRRRLAKETGLNIRKSGSATRISGPETRSGPLVRDALAPTSNDNNDDNDDNHNNYDDNCNDNNDNNYDDNNGNYDNEDVDIYNEENNDIRGGELRRDHHDCDNYDALVEIPCGIFPFNNMNNDNDNANNCEDSYDYINKYGVNDNEYAGIFPHNGIKKNERTGILPQASDNFFDIHDDNHEGYDDHNDNNYPTGILPPHNYSKDPILVSNSIPTRKPEYSDIQKPDHIRKPGYPDIQKPEYLDLRASRSSRGILENSDFFDTNKPAVSIGRDMGLGVRTGARDRADVSTAVRDSTCVRTGDWWRANTHVPSSMTQTDNSTTIKNKHNCNDYNTTKFNDYTSYNDMHDVNDMIPSFSLTHKNVDNYMEKNTDHLAYRNPFRNKTFNSNYQNGGNTNSDYRKNEIKPSTRGLLSFAH